MDTALLEYYCTLPLSTLEPFLKKKTACLVLPPTHTQKFVGFVTKPLPLQKFQSEGCDITPAGFDFKIISNLLPARVVQELKNFYHSNPKVTMSPNMIKKQYGYHDQGIARASYYDYFYAWQLFQQSYNYLPKFKIINGEIYLLCQFNPLLRFVEYQQENYLTAHYDMPVPISNELITQATIIFYLTTNQSGQTRFINNSGIINNYQDWQRQPTEEEIIYSVCPTEGNALVFNHGILHDSNTFSKTEEENKTIITTELLYYKIREPEFSELIHEIINSNL